MKPNTRKILDQNTPFTVIELGNVEVRQYQTKGGTGGSQVLTVVLNYPNFQEFKTGGGGYCKASDGLANAFKSLGIKPKGMTLGGETMPLDYRVGGNFYKVPKSKIVKVKVGE